MVSLGIVLLLSLITQMDGTEVAISGMVLVEDKPPEALAPKIVVELNMTGKDGDGIRSVVSPDGEFWFYQLRVATYQLSARLEGYRTARSEIQVSAGGQVRGNAKLVLLKESEVPTVTREGEVVSQNELRASPKIRAQTDRAERALEAGDIRTALDALDKVLKENPEYARALFLRGSLAARQGDEKAAIVYYEKSLRADRDFYRAYAALAAIQVSRAALTELRDVADRWKAVEPLKASPYYYSAIAYYELGEYPAALQEVQIAFGLPHQGLPHLRLLAANCYVKLNQLSSAAEELKKFLAEHPDDGEAPAAQVTLGQIRKVMEAQK